jgi:isoamylase
MQVWPGRPYPLGATYDGVGTNFAVFSEVAQRVELCLSNDDGAEQRVPLDEVDGYVWHCFVAGVGPGQRYAYRIHGDYDPERGQRCNPAKLLLDPYAKTIDGAVRWDPAVYSYPLGGDDLQLETSDSAPYMPRAVVTNPWFEWGDDHRLRRPWHETIVYELHVKGFTARHPDVPAELRGTYAGLAHPAAVAHLTELGVTAVELMPVHHFVHDHVLVDRGLSNYWGYNSIGFFAPHSGYSAWGIEQVVNEFRSSNMRHPHVLQLIVDSLRYWVTEMHVDGFRFDLAASLARQFHEVDRLSAFFDLIQIDPVVSQVKLIAEPWDLGEGGYQVGNFPTLWSEWNGRYRDTVRDYRRSVDRTLADLAYRITGSSDLYGRTGRRPYASINFVTAHDGFTLTDLVTYDHKHNDANGEGNRDGDDHNRSWNSGIEGPTEDPTVLELRGRRRRALLATLLLSQGVPMIRAGDEIGHTQHGNNNAYCQDNDISWLQWETADAELFKFCQHVIDLRARHPVVRRRRFFEGRPLRGEKISDIAWFRPDGIEMSDHDWSVGFARSLTVFLNGAALPDPDPLGQQMNDDNFLILLNANDHPITFTLPPGRWGHDWVTVLDTAIPNHAATTITAGSTTAIAGFSLHLLGRSGTPR